MGFSIRVAPGVRIRASSRGVRTSVGPRIARVHVGSGRTGFSTGLGPVSYYTSLGGPGSRSSGGSPQRSTQYVSTSSGYLTAAQANKQEAAASLSAALNAILSLHRHAFAPMQRPHAPPPAPVDVAAMRRALRKQNLVGIGIFARAERRVARTQADQAGDALAALEAAGRQRQFERDEHGLGEWWARLLANDPDVTEQLLNQAFDDNDAPAIALSIQGAEATVVVMIPDRSVVPERFPTTTASGNLSLRKMTKAEIESYYREVLCGITLVTVREAFAVAPGISDVRVVALRDTGPNVFGAAGAEALLTAVFNRATLEAVRWDEAFASAIVRDAARESTVNYRGVAQTVTPLDLRREPDLANLMSLVDFEELI